MPDLPALVERDIPTLPDLDPLATQERLLGVIESVFRAQFDPVLVLLEDLHWLSSESLAVLSHLARIVPVEADAHVHAQRHVQFLTQRLRHFVMLALQIASAKIALIIHN